MPIMKVEGMHCQNCVKAVTEAVSALPGAKGVEVSLEKGQVKWDEMGVSEEKVKEAIEANALEAHGSHCPSDK